MNDRSELMNWKSPGLLRLMKSGEGGVVETSWMFQAASPASIHPARSPTRGSGLGAAVEKGRWDGAHAATDNATIANNASDFTEGSLKGH